MPHLLHDQIKHFLIGLRRPLHLPAVLNDISCLGKMKWTENGRTPNQKDNLKSDYCSFQTSLTWRHSELTFPDVQGDPSHSGASCWIQMEQHLSRLHFQLKCGNFTHLKPLKSFHQSLWSNMYMNSGVQLVEKVLFYVVNLIILDLN